MSGDEGAEAFCLGVGVFRASLGLVGSLGEREGSEQDGVQGRGLAAGDGAEGVVDGSDVAFEVGVERVGPQPDGLAGDGDVDEANAQSVSWARVGVGGT